MRRWPLFILLVPHAALADCVYTGAKRAYVECIYDHVMTSLSDIGALTADVLGLDSRVGATETDVDGLTADLASLSLSVSALDGALGDAEGDLGALQSDLALFEGAVTDELDAIHADLDAMSPGAAVGTAANPGRSCLHILEAGGSTGDGIYTIRGAAGGGPRAVFCDMTLDGGGWTLIVNKLQDMGQTGWTRVVDPVGKAHLLGDSRPSTDNKDILVRVPGSQVMMRKVGAVGGPEEAVRTPNLGSAWATFYDGWFGRGGNLCEATEATASWVTKYSQPGILCECKGGEGCSVAFQNAVLVGSDLRISACGQNDGYFGDSSTTGSALATHFPPGCTLSPSLSWTRLYVR